MEPPAVAVPEADCPSKLAADLSTDDVEVSLVELQVRTQAQSGSVTSSVESKSTVWRRFIERSRANRRQDASRQTVPSLPTTQGLGPDALEAGEGFVSDAAAE